MKTEIVAGKVSIFLGRQGEHLARNVVFDLSEWVAVYGDGTAELIHQRPGDAQPYPVPAVREGSRLVWTVSRTDTAVAADLNHPGHCELRWYVGDALVKSQTWLTCVNTAMDTPAQSALPSPEQGWVEQVLSAGAAAAEATRQAGISAQAAVEAAGRAEKAQVHGPMVQNGSWWIYDQTAGAHVDSGVAATGPAGPAGKDGADGADGRDGADGADGYTPVKGVDYGTPEEINKMAQSAAEILRPDVDQLKEDITILGNEINGINAAIGSGVIE